MVSGTAEWGKDQAREVPSGSSVVNTVEGESSSTSREQGPSTQYPWYAVRVRSNFEKVASQALQHRGYNEFVPYYRAKRRWSDRTRVVDFPLFPGYVFCRFNPERRLPVLQAPGVVGVVGFGGELYPIEEAEIESVKTLVNYGRDVQPWPALKVGQKVRIRGGSLNGIEGILLKLKNGRRLVVSISLLQRAVAAELGREDVEPVF